MGAPAATRIIDKAADLSDVGVAAPAELHVLSYDATAAKWVNRALAAAGISGTAHTHADVIAAGASGFMSGADKTKLDGIAAGAEVNQNAFATILVSGQPDVVANVEGAGVTLAAGANVSLTTDAATRTVTITASGSGGGAGVFNDLGDVVITTPALGHIARYDGTNWVNVVPTTEYVGEHASRLYYTTARVNTDAPNVTIGATANGLSVAAGQVLSLAAATGAAGGAMSSADKVKLDAATASNTAGTIVLRNGSGLINAASLGTGTADATTFLRGDGTYAVPGGGGGGTPGGADTQVQFNDGGAFGGDAGLTYNKTTNLLTITGGQLVLAAGTITADKPVDVQQTWNNGPTLFRAYATNITVSAAHADSCHYDAQESGVSVWNARRGGNTVQSGAAVIGKRATAGVAALTIAGTITTDASLGNHFHGTLSGAHTLAAPTNALDGQKVVWEIQNNAGGTATLALDTGAGGFITPTGITVTIAGANARHLLGAVYSSRAAKWLVAFFQGGY